MEEYSKMPTGLELTNEEDVLWYGRRSWRSLIGLLTLGFLFFLVGLIFFILGVGNGDGLLGIIGLIIFVLGIILLIAAILKRFGSEYAITNKRVYCRYGLISRRTSEAVFDKITDSSLSQGVLGRLLNYGTLRINTAGANKFEIIFKGIVDPKYIQSKIRSVYEKYQRDLRIKERIEKLEDKYLIGEITEEQFEEAKKRLENMF